MSLCGGTTTTGSSLACEDARNSLKALRHYVLVLFIFLTILTFKLW